MNLGIIIYMLGWIMKVEAVLMLVPTVTAVIYGEKEGFCYLAVALVCGGLGLIFSRKKPENRMPRLRTSTKTKPKTAQTAAAVSRPRPLRRPR